MKQKKKRKIKRSRDDWTEFRKANGLYTAAQYSEKWIGKFREIYGYTPVLS